MLNGLLKIDFWLLQMINSEISNKLFSTIFPVITDLHKLPYLKYFILALIVFSFLRKYLAKGLVLFLLLGLCVGTSDFVGAQVKSLVQRERPENSLALAATYQPIIRSSAGHYSFYSNHASNMYALAFFLAVFFPFYRNYFFLMAFLVGFSRIYNGVHFPSDVLCGSLIGYFIARLYIYIIKKIPSLRDLI